MTYERLSELRRFFMWGAFMSFSLGNKAMWENSINHRLFWCHVTFASAIVIPVFLPGKIPTVCRALCLVGMVLNWLVTASNGGLMPILAGNDVGIWRHIPHAHFAALGDNYFGRFGVSIGDLVMLSAVAIQILWAIRESINRRATTAMAGVA